VATLEDGLYVMEAKLKDPAFVARMAKFLKATFKGWNDAVKDPEAAAKVVVAADASGSATLKVQKRQMENVAKLIPMLVRRRSVTWSPLRMSAPSRCCWPVAARP
jgi:NitT/TauT family transport system substrate-binding protein